MKVVSSAQNAELHWSTNNSDRKLTESIVGHVTILSSRPDAMDAAMSLEQVGIMFVLFWFDLIHAKLVNHSRHSEFLNIRKNSEIDDIFLSITGTGFVDFQTYFKDSLYLE